MNFQEYSLQILEMKKTITDLLTALIEESNDVNKENVMEVKESLDQLAIYENVVMCYKLITDEVGFIFWKRL